MVSFRLQNRPVFSQDDQPQQREPTATPPNHGDQAQQDKQRAVPPPTSGGATFDAVDSTSPVRKLTAAMMDFTFKNPEMRACGGSAVVAAAPDSPPLGVPSPSAARQAKALANSPSWRLGSPHSPSRRRVAATPGVSKTASSSSSSPAAGAESTKASKTPGSSRGGSGGGATPSFPTPYSKKRLDSSAACAGTHDAYGTDLSYLSVAMAGAPVPSDGGGNDGSVGSGAFTPNLALADDGYKSTFGVANVSPRGLEGVTGWGMVDDDAMCEDGTKTGRALREQGFEETAAVDQNVFVGGGNCLRGGVFEPPVIVPFVEEEMETVTAEEIEGSAREWLDVGGGGSSTAATAGSVLTGVFLAARVLAEKVSTDSCLFVSSSYLAGEFFINCLFYTTSGNGRAVLLFDFFRNR